MVSKPGIIIWSSAIVCVALAWLALADLLEQTTDAGRSKAVGILVLVGIAALASVWRLVRRYRTAAEAARPADITQVPIGVPIRPSRGKALAVAIAVLAIGAVPLILMNNLTPVTR